jgi:hypothetical protein
MIFDGDATRHLSVYAQAEFSAATSAAEFSLQMRDYYADIALDRDREYRFRIGQYKVPYGWVNLQSSQNRGPFERPDAINGAFEDARDIGAAFMWAPAKIRERFSELTGKGLKGSGDAGVLAIGAYSGQGPNRPDLNGQLHYVARASYPFRLASGRIFEVGVQAYRGRFVVSTTGIPVGADGASVTPRQGAKGVLDQRAGLSFVWYPQPLGLQAEWNIGTGPELADGGLSIESRRLSGGYVQLDYLRDSRTGKWYPFVRWNYYRRGRKFGTNAPREQINEIDLGIEWSPWSELELTAMYTHSFERTNTRTFPYGLTTHVYRAGLQAQWNF